MSQHYCTYFDHRYAGMGLAMLRSLRQHGATGCAWILCLSDEAARLVGTFDVPNIRAITLSEIEAHFPDLPAVRATRSTLEYYFTMTPHIIQYVFDKAPDATDVAYLDGDLFFFAPPAIVWAEAKDAPVALIPHNFQRGAKRFERFGIYNVGWVSFRRKPQGLACLDYWARSCRDWCYDVPEPGRFADQGYLDQFHELAPDLAVIRHPGCNLAPWNIANYRISLSAGSVMVGDSPLAFFHFAGFKKAFGGYWFNSHRTYGAGTSRIVRDHIYKPYLAARAAAQREMTARSPILAQEMKLARKRGNGFTPRAWAVQTIEQIFRLYDLATGKALREP